MCEKKAGILVHPKEPDLNGKLGSEPGELDWAADALERHLEEVVPTFKEQLQARQSPLLSDSRSGERLYVQARTIVEDVVQLLRGKTGPTAEIEDQLSKNIGTLRAEEGIHPKESVRAALILSRTILSVIYRELPQSAASQKETARVASTVYECALERVVRASASYWDYLLLENQKSHTEERRRIGRELHDRIANSLAVVYHNVNLYESLKDENPSRAQEKLDIIRETSWEALISARSLSAELRKSLGKSGLEAALSDLLATLVPEEIHASISATGDESLAPYHIREELFLILREAIRNAVIHSEARWIKTELSTKPGLIRAEVLDDGRGVDTTSENFIPGTGVESMIERTNLLGGSFRVGREPDGGTRVEVRVPLGKNQE